MNKRYIAIGLICVYILFIGYGCSNSKQTAKDPQLSQGLSQTNDIEKSDDVKEIPDDGNIPEESTMLGENPIAELPDTTCDLIDEAIADETLSRAEGISLKLMAIFEPESLPSGYIGEDNLSDDVFHNIQWDIQWLYDNWDTLDSQQQDFFFPFLAFPEDITSVYNTGLNESNVINMSASVNGNDVKNLSIGTDSSFIAKNLSTTATIKTPNTKYKSEYLEIDSNKKIFIMGDYPNDTALQNAYDLKWQTLKAAIEYCFPLYKKYFGKDLDMDLGIYLHKLPKVYGLASRATFTNSKESRQAYYIQLAERMNGNMLQASLAHELFHIFQDIVGARYNTDDEKWLLEATAVWAEDFAYPTFDTEHAYSEWFFDLLPARHLFSVIKTDEYSRHLFIRFLVQYQNDDKIPLKLILESTANHDVRATVEKALGDKMEAFAEYSLYNWNQKPFLKYSDIGKFPSHTPLFASMLLSVRGKYPRNYTIPPTLQGNLVYTFHGDVLKFPVINMSFEYQTQKKPTIMALLQTPSGWTREDWTGLTEKKIDRVEGENRLDKIVLLISNPDFTDTIKCKVYADTSVTENSILILQNSTEVKYDDGTTAFYEGSYTARMNVDFDENSSAYYYDKLNAVYKGKTIIEGLLKDSVGTIQRQFDDSERNTFIYSFGDDVLCQFWPYLNESYVNVTTTVNFDGGSVSNTEKGIPQPPEVLMHMLQFKEKNGVMELTVQDIDYVVNYEHSGSKLTINIKYEGETNSLLDSAGTTKTKGTIQYTHYLSD